ncbi:MAG TPA: hypothetical protein VFO85_01660 [Vicinamibacteria bacterium]|nr:hypothetical protein [Vicinamibacteria bacterium]
MLIRSTMLVLAAWMAPALVAAQTADVFFGGWSWRTRDPGSRPAGLGGAYVAVADGVRTTAINPAGLALIPRVEAAAGILPRWAGLARRLEGAVRVQPVTQGDPALAVCPPGRRARPWTAAVYVEQSESRRNDLEVVRGPGAAEAATLEAASEELGGGVAKGVFPWLDVGATLAWRHLRLDGASIVSDALDREQQRVTLAGDANKARAILGALASFGPQWTPTSVRLGVAYQWDLTKWSVERRTIDRVRGVAADPTEVAVLEPAVLSGGLAWRISDDWLVAGQLDYTWFDQIAKATARSAGTGGFVVRNHFEPRGAIEMTRSSPIGGYYKVRAGLRREISGRVTYDGDDPVLRQAFQGSPAAFRGSVGVSFLAEFYEKAVRLDVDLSQVVLQRQSSLSAAGTRRLSIGLTGRL